MPLLAIPQGDHHQAHFQVAVATPVQADQALLPAVLMVAVRKVPILLQVHPVHHPTHSGKIVILQALAKKAAGEHRQQKPRHEQKVLLTTIHQLQNLISPKLMPIRLGQLIM